MRQRWLRVLFRRRMLTILLLLLQVYFLICLVLGGSQLSRNFSRLLTIVSIIAVLYIVSQKDKGALQNCMGDPGPNLPVVWWTDVSFV